MFTLKESRRERFVLYSMPIEHCGIFSTRIKNCLWNAGYSKIGDLKKIKSKYDLLKIKNFSWKSLRSFERVCAENKIKLLDSFNAPKIPKNTKSQQYDKLIALLKKRENLDGVKLCIVILQDFKRRPHDSTPNLR